MKVTPLNLMFSGLYRGKKLSTVKHDLKEAEIKEKSTVCEIKKLYLANYGPIISDRTATISSVHFMMKINRFYLTETIYELLNEKLYLFYSSK